MASVDKKRRMVYLSEKLIGGDELTVKIIQTLVNEEFGGKLENRAAERDLVTLQEMFPYAKLIKEGTKKVLFIENALGIDKQSSMISNNWGSYLLSLHMLKSHLLSFKDSEVSEQIDSLITKIEEKTGQTEIISSDSLYWDQNYGKFNYSKAGSDYIEVINKLTEFIKDQKWIKLKYMPRNGGRVTYKVKPYQFFYFSGTLYFACYNYDKKQTYTFAIHRILEVKKLIGEDKVKHEAFSVPDFNYAEFREKRFGVFSDIPVTVILEVDQNYRRYFTNRIFHDSQTTFNEGNKDEPIIINLKVPLAPELVAWVLKWNGGLKVKKPKQLKDMVRNAAQRIVDDH